MSNPLAERDDADRQAGLFDSFLLIPGYDAKVRVVQFPGALDQG